MLFDFNISITTSGEMGRWSRAKVGLGKRKKTACLTINTATRSHIFPLDKLRKLHSAALEFSDPNRVINIRCNDAHQLKVFMKLCYGLFKGTIDTDRLERHDLQKSVKPQPTSLKVQGKNYTKDTFKNTSLAKIHFDGTSPLPNALWDLRNLTSLTLNNCNLKDFPSSIHKIGDNLKTLDLSKNKIKRLEPVFFLRLKNIAFLDLSHNELRFLPLTLFGLRSMTVLKLANNKIHNLPFTITLLVNLKELDISNNCITKLPEIVLAKLATTIKLVSLDISNNVHPKYEEKERPFQFPDLFSLAASAALRSHKTVMLLYQYLPYYLEDLIHIRGEICCSCKRGFIRFKPVEGVTDFYLGRIASSVCGSSTGSYNIIKAYRLNCFYCEHKLIKVDEP